MQISPITRSVINTYQRVERSKATVPPRPLKTEHEELFHDPNDHRGKTIDVLA